MSAENDRLAEESVAAPVVPAQGVAYATMPPRKPMSKKSQIVDNGSVSCCVGVGCRRGRHQYD